MRLGNYCPNTTREMIFVNIENGKTNEAHKFVLKLSQRLNLRSSNKHVAQLAYLLHLEKYVTTVQKQ